MKTFQIVIGEATFLRKNEKFDTCNEMEDLLNGFKELKDFFEKQEKNSFEIESFKIKDFNKIKREEGDLVTMLFYADVEISNEEVNKFLKKAEELKTEFINVNS